MYISRLFSVVFISWETVSERVGMSLVCGVQSRIAVAVTYEDEFELKKSEH